MSHLNKWEKVSVSELSRTWENLTEGWHELLSRSNETLTHFSRKKDEEHTESSYSLASFPNWSLLAGEVEETDKEILVWIEVLGMEKEDLQITINGNVFSLCGEKRIERESHDRYLPDTNTIYHIYGAFQRAITPPRDVNTNKAKATYR